MQPEKTSLISSVYPPPLFISKGRTMCGSIHTHIQVTEIFVIVQSIAYNEAVGDFKSNIYKKNTEIKFEPVVLFGSVRNEEMEDGSFL